MANLRDVLSHLATLLDPSTPADKRGDQLASAEEHLRRAIIEPYEIALGALNEKFIPTYDSYREKLIPIRGLTEGFRTAPARLDIENRLKDIDELAEKGKQAKARNRWDEEWEVGVAALIDAYNRQSDLHNEIEEWVFKHHQHLASQEQAAALRAQSTTSHQHTNLHRWGIAWTIVGIFVGAVLGYLYAKYAGSIGAPSAPTTITEPTK
jgi:hypothetical protein